MMEKYVRVAAWMDGRYIFGIGVWPIREYGGVGFSITFLWYEFALYVNPLGWKD